MNIDKPIVVALDFSTEEACIALVNKLDPSKVRLKVGKELFAVAGPELVKKLVAKGFDVFLDLKYHDIPNTVAKAVAAAARLGIWMVNVHASGGSRMMKAAREALNEFGRPPLLIGVTVLTSMDESDLGELGITLSPKQQVQKLAQLAKESGLDGVVCSAQEAHQLKEQCGSEFKLVTPGIRPAGSTADDQRRTLTPKEALSAGSDFLVIGRPITAASDPAAACQAIIDSLAD
ncbi:orotidine-5'-phosphate decarboxylase [Aurantivibrio plasticivorans]